MIKQNFIFVFILLLFYFFTLGCTQQREEKISLKSEYGVVIKNVSYSKEIGENEILNVKVLIKNDGDVDSKNVKVFMEGLSIKWNPATPIERTIISLPKDYETYIDFSSSPAILGENISYSFYFRIEYDYVSKYLGILEVRKEENISRVRLTSELTSKSPIKINLSSYKYDETSNKLILSFSILNKEKGKVLGDIILVPEDMICRTTRTRFLKDEKSTDEIICEIALPNNFVSYSPQVTLTANFRYTYNSNEYKVDVFKS
ncbi:MAG: hypothetical protein QXY70_02020 [Nanopusillaceae archaeon]